MVRISARIVANFMTMIAEIRNPLYRWYLKLMISDGIQVQGRFVVLCVPRVSRRRPNSSAAGEGCRLVMKDSRAESTRDF